MRLIPVVFLSFALSFSAFAENLLLIKGTVLKISDGDTIQFQPDPTSQTPAPKKVSVRFKDIDTPETHLSTPDGEVSQGIWGERATDQLTRLISVGDKIEVTTVGLDQHGRSLGILAKNGIDINYEMLTSGWAAFYMICDKACEMKTTQLKRYRSACKSAMEKGLGNFDPANPLPELPYQFRARMGKTKPHRLVGNIDTGKYVTPEQVEKVPLCNRVFFETVEAAEANKFVPANATL